MYIRKSEPTRKLNFGISELPKFYKVNSRADGSELPRCHKLEKLKSGRDRSELPRGSKRTPVQIEVNSLAVTNQKSELSPGDGEGRRRTWGRVVKGRSHGRGGPGRGGRLEKGSGAAGGG